MTTKEEIKQLRFVGRQMSNVLYNLSQSPRLNQNERYVLRKLVSEWDSISEAPMKTYLAQVSPKGAQ